MSKRAQTTWTGNFSTDCSKHVRAKASLGTKSLGKGGDFATKYLVRQSKGDHGYDSRANWFIQHHFGGAQICGFY
jgi:hypothetical protein